jgi:GalNAc-alpha-(1->4)-GalNAc-alpha-(1->3)-diNAcBac-PP-undecaprenol alpha-1,4-N-acetyl-D-galactosaminyltransferase
MRIALSITDLSGGGAARVATVLGNAWCAMGHEVHLITFETPGTATFFKVDDVVVRHQISAVQSGGSAFGFMWTNIKRVSRLRQLFKTIQPDISISFLLEANVVSVIAAQCLPFPTIVAERNHPAYHHVSRIKAFLRKGLYRRANAVCVQTREIGDWFAQNLSLDTVVIPNPIPSTTGRATNIQSGRSRRIVLGLGRLEPQKGFSRLLDAFSLVAAENWDWDLVIYGEGSERPALEAQAKRLGLQDRIVLPGVTENPEAQLKRADLFAHTARYEGYPNAILEAAAVGACIIAMDSPGAASEILVEDDCGVLISDGDVEAFAGQMAHLMNAPDARAAFGARARLRVASLSPAIIAQAWIDLAQAKAVRAPIVRSSVARRS